MTTNRFRLTKDIDAVSNYPAKHNARETKLAETILKNKNIDENFDSALNYSAIDKEGNAPLASAPAAGDEVVFSTRKSQFELHVNAVNGTPVWLVPSVSADGLEMAVDADATNGITAWELSNGILDTSNAAFTVGTDKPFFAEATIKIDDISDLTELWFGFRKAAAYTVDPDDYTDMAAFNIGKDADGQIEIHTILNNAATSETDTTEADWADAAEYTLRVTCNQDGVCKFYIDGAEPTVTASFTFDSGDKVVPFLCMTTAVGDPGVSISSWRVGTL